MTLENRNTFTANTAVFVTSFSVLCYEIIFTRVFAYSQWHNLSSLIITIALLGFGASGTAAALCGKLIEGKYGKFMFASSLLFPVSIAAGFYASAFLDFNPYEMAFNTQQAVYFFLYFLLMGIPFFAGASVIYMALLRYNIPSAYFFNLLGSGAGALAAMVFLFFLHPYDIMTLIVFIAFIPALLASPGSRKNLTVVALCAAVTAASAFYISGLPGFKKVSQYKSISGALNLPGSRVLYSGYSPLSVVQVVEAKGLRSTAGLSVACPHHVPVQKGIFFDGDSMSSVTPFDGDMNKVRYIEFLASYLPYYLRKDNDPGKMRIIGSGGGESILKSILSGFEKVDAVEVNGNVISLMKNKFSEFSGNIYNRENLTVINSDGRSYIKQTDEKYDLIEISLLDAYNTAASGVYALNETYLYTTGSFRDYFSRLTDKGMLSVTRWITTPPRDTLKLFNTAIESLAGMNIKNKENHLAAIRSLQTVTLLVSKRPFTHERISGLRKFCAEKYFDIIYCPGIQSAESERFIKLQEPVYYDAFMKLLSDEKGRFVDGYDFDITAPSDDRPYFYNFFKPRFLDYIKKYGPAQVPVTEWGCLILLIILVPVVIISFVCIVIPVMSGGKGNRNPGMILFFSLIAAGFFSIEMPLIQKMVLFLGHPSYSISVIIAGMLIFSGTGSWFSDRIFPEKYRILVASLFVGAIILLYQLILDRMLAQLMPLNVILKILVVLALVAPPAFFMGFPFPQGLVRVKEGNPGSLPLAWGVNGFFSVISIIAAALIAILSGFRAVFLTAAACYVLAGMASVRLYKNE
jgi:spermidine synthase